jgi:hypothetical protein
LEVTGLTGGLCDLGAGLRGEGEATHSTHDTDDAPLHV